MSEVPAWFLFLSRRGRVGGAVMLVIGLTILAVTAAWLVARTGVGIAAPIFVVGLLFVAFGAGSLFGSQGRMDSAVRAHPPNTVTPRADPRGVAQQQPLPFWICSDCRVVEPGLSAQCIRCGKTVAFVLVRDEDERRTAVAALPAP